MQTAEIEAHGAFCLYPPRVGEEVDVTEQVEGDKTRYVVRNRATARYFLFKPVEYEIFRRFDGAHSAAEVAAAGGAVETGARPSAASVVKFLTKLDTMSLLARGGEEKPAGLAGPRRQGFYLKFPLLDPNAFLAWLDRRIGWALSAPFVIASLVAMAVVAYGVAVRFGEFVPSASRMRAVFGMAVVILAIITVTVMHEMAHGLACKHFGGDVREMGVMLLFYAIPAFYCNVTDVYRLGRKRERLWVIFAGIYLQLTVGAFGGIIWLLAAPGTPLADLGFLIFFAGTLNVFVNCNPLIKLDGYYALQQWLGVQNLQAHSEAYVRSLVAGRLGMKAEPPKGRPRPLLYVGYWLLSMAYTLFLIWFVVNWASGWLIGWFGTWGKVMTVGLLLLFGERLWRPVVVRAFRLVSRKPGARRRTEAGSGVEADAPQKVLEAR
jgi:putative peptide zinc metalloprotease protein